MKVLMINGSPNMHGCTYTALHEIEGVLGRHNIETEILYLGQKAMNGCTACRTCRSTGKCIFDDKVNEINARFDEFDGLIIGSPVYYSSAAGQLTAFLDRLFFSSSKGQWMGKPGASVVSCRRGGATATFDQLNKYFTINNMPIVSANYWNQVHGSTPEEVLQDEEGMQTMRVLGENMAWLLKCIAAGREAGVAEPVYEPRVYTNFIR